MLARLNATVRQLAEEERVVPAARRLRFLLTADAAERYADGRQITVLDAGCGDGRLAHALAARRPEWKIVGGDRDEQRLAIGRERAQRSGLRNLAFERIDLTGDLGEDAYDLVLAVECLEEIDDDDRALVSMARALRPGGLLVVHVPQSEWRPFLKGADATWRHEVRHGYGSEELREKLERSGLHAEMPVATSHALVQLAQDLRDQARHRSLRPMLALRPLALAAVALEHRGLKLGEGRAWMVQGLRPQTA